MIYFGIVENIQDPLKSGRVQVRVYPFYKDFAVKDLPWAYVERSTDFGPTAGRGINQHNLVIGSQVTVEFLDLQLQQPIVRGVLPRTDDFNEETSFTEHTMSFINGTKITVNEDPEDPYIRIIDTEKNVIEMNTQGIIIHVGDSKKVINLESEGDVNIISGNSVNVKDGKDLKIEVSGDSSITTKGDTKISTSGKTDIESKGETNINSSASMNIKSSGELTIEGSKVNLKNILGKNQLCGIPACLFTGAPHIQPNSD